MKKISVGRKGTVAPGIAVLGDPGSTAHLLVLGPLSSNPRAFRRLRAILLNP